MNTSIQSLEEPDTKPFVISRAFDAPLHLVWQVWTEAEHMRHWWAPKGSSVKTCNLDIRPGGVLHYCLSSPDGQEMWGKSVYREVVPEKKLIFINSFSDKDGGLSRHPKSTTWPLEMHTTITFAEHEGKTTLTIRWIPVSPTDEERTTFDNAHDGMRQGWTGTLDYLDEYLVKALAAQEIISTRVIDAPRDQVFEAWTDPEKLAQWWGPKGFTNTFHEFDLRTGGQWQFVMHGPDGTDYKNESVFLEIVKPERIVFDHVSPPKFRVFANFTEESGKTKLIFRMVFESAKLCEQLKPICVPSNEENFDRLAALLAKA